METINVDEELVRDYSDNFSVKEMVVDTLVPKYFEEETSNMTIGLTGMMSELVSNMAEDSFNACTTLLLETFPTRARMENSIYSNAAVFQLSDVFSDSARCEFLIILSEKDVIRNFRQEQGGKYQCFYIDKNTTVYVEDIPFVFDYDIVIRAINRETKGGYIYSAKYDMTEYVNTAGITKDPYIKIRKSANGLLALQVNMGQYLRSVKYENIVDNMKVNYPTINVGFLEKLSGLDVLYKGPNDSDFNTQLKLLTRYSPPIKEPFCYYRKKDDNMIELSFTTKDTYFQPEFNSEIKTIVYNTMGENGNFDKYTGDEISLIKNTEKYQYLYSYSIVPKPFSSSAGGKEALTKEGLQALTIEGYTTANALTTEHDLQVHFNNYKHRYGAEVLFIKKRDDPAERIFSAFLYVKKGDYFYPTNTLSLDTNILNFNEKEQGYYNMDPGHLFSYKRKDIYRVLPIYYVTDGEGEYYDAEGNLYDKEGNKTSTKISVTDLEKKFKAGDVWKNPDQYYKLFGDMYYLTNSDDTKAEVIYRDVNDDSYYLLTDIKPNRVYYHYDKFKKLIEDRAIPESEVLNLFSSNAVIKERDDEYNDPIEMDETDLILKFREKGLTYDTIEMYDGKFIDFVKDEEKDLEYRYDYLNYYETYMNIKYYNIAPDNPNADSYYLLVKADGKDRHYLEYKKGGKELVSNTKYTEAQIQNLLSAGHVRPDANNREITMSEYLFNFSFKDYKKMMNVNVNLKVFDPDIENIAKKYDFLFTNPFLMSITKSNGLIGYYLPMTHQEILLDFIEQNDADAFVQFITYTFNIERKMEEEKRYHLSLNILPSVSIDSDYTIVDKDSVYDETKDSLFYETENDVPHSLMTYDKKNLHKNNLRVIVCFYDLTGNEFQGYLEMIPTEIKSREQFKFEAEFISDDYVIGNNQFRIAHQCPYCGKKVYDSVNIKEHEFLHDYYCESCDKYFDEGIINVNEIDDVWLPNKEAIVKIYTLFSDPTESFHPTDNIFTEYDESFEGYHWTNVYSTITDPVTFIEPMNLLRSNISYLDYYTTGIDALDCRIYDIPFMKYSLIAYQDHGPSVTDSLEADDIGKFSYFLDSYVNHYRILNEAELLLINNGYIDTKFYNTYGRSTNFTIGENGEMIDTVNIRIYFDIWLLVNTDIINAETELKTYIKDYIESINKDGTNDLFISNLIRGIENTFSYVHHLYFRGINKYDTSYQAIKNKAISLKDLKKEERRYFVPDLLNVNRSNIILRFFDVKE